MFIQFDNYYYRDATVSSYHTHIQVIKKVSLVYATLYWFMMLYALCRLYLFRLVSCRCSFRCLRCIYRCLQSFRCQKRPLVFALLLPLDPYMLCVFPCIRLVVVFLKGDPTHVDHLGHRILPL